MRLDKLLCQENIGTRSQVQKIIRGGKVEVNGLKILNPSLHVTLEKDEISVDGETINGKMNHYILLHKPSGILTAARDKKAKTVMDLLPPVYMSRECMPVGRLDKDTTGLLLFTTDGELSHRLLSPKRHVEKEYVAWVDGMLTLTDVEAFQRGIPLTDFTCLPARLEIVSATQTESIGKAFVQEGKFHQIKRMFGARGFTVAKLHREAFGPLRLNNNPPIGTYRELTKEEVQALYTAAEMI